MSDHDVLAHGRLFGCLTAAALTLSATPALAQSVDATPRVVVLEELGLTKIRDLDFGDVLVTGTAGSVQMAPGTTTATCTATNVLHFATCQPAVFGGEGQFGQRIRVRLPARQEITVTGPGADMLIDTLMVEVASGLNRLSPAGSRRNISYRITDTDGVFLFRLGGTLNLAADQTPGIYEGTFNVQIDYR